MAHRQVHQLIMNDAKFYGIKSSILFAVVVITDLQTGLLKLNFHQLLSPLVYKQRRNFICVYNVMK